MKLYVSDTTGHIAVPIPGKPVPGGYREINPLRATLPPAPWRWDPDVEAIVTAEPVPPVVLAWKAKALLASTPAPEGGNLLSVLDATLRAQPDSVAKTVLLSAWDNNADFALSSPTIQYFGALLSMTELQIAQMFIAANKLEY